MNNFTSRLRSAVQQERWQWVLLTVALAWWLAALLALGLHAVESAQTWREPTADLVWRVWEIAVLALVLASVGAPRRQTTEQSVARRLDRLRPSSRDRFSCAVEIAGNPMAMQLPLNRLVVKQVEAEAADPRLWASLTPWWRRWVLVVPAFLAALVAVSLTTTLPVAEKARFHRDGAVGLQVAPGATEVAVGSDLEITAEVLRWEPEATLELRQADGTIEVWPMDVVSAAGEASERFGLTVFSVADDFGYRIVTPSLASPWFSVAVFQPAELEGLEVSIEPPLYTGLEPTRYELAAPRDFSVPEGSRVEVKLATKGALAVSWVQADRTLAEGHRFEWVARETTRGWLRLIDAAGRTTITPPFTLEVIPDEPPTVTLLEPTGDVTLPLGDPLPIEVYAADDYGVTSVRLQVTVAGLDRPSVTLFSAPEEFSTTEKSGASSRDGGRDPAATSGGGTFEREITLLRSFNPSDLGAENQTVVTYFFEVTDNRQPNPQVSRSALHFVEIRNPIDPQTLTPEQVAAGEGAERVQLDLRTLILELRRLIRATYGLEFLSADLRSRAQVEVSAGLGGLRLELQKLLNEVGPMLWRIEGGEFGMMLEEATTLLDEAGKAVVAGEIESALERQQEVYTSLLRVEAFLQAIAEAQQSAGEGGEGSPPPPSPTASETSEAAGPLMERLAEARQRMLELADQQRLLNDGIRSFSGELTAAEASGLFSEQRRLAQQLQAAASEVADALAAAPAAARSTAQAASRMADAAASLSRRDGPTAARQGDRAQAALLETAAALEQLRQQVVAQVVNALASEAAALARDQELLARGEQPPSPAGSSGQPESAEPSDRSASGANPPPAEPRDRSESDSGSPSAPSGQAASGGESGESGDAGQSGQAGQQGQSGQSGQSGQAGQSGRGGQSGQQGQAGVSGRSGQGGSGRPAQGGQPGAAGESASPSAAGGEGNSAEGGGAGGGVGRGDASGRAGSRSPSSLREQQQALLERLQDLARQTNQAAGQLAPDLPEVAEQLRGSLEALQAGRAESAMERAANALLYGQQDRAQALQSGAAEGISQFSEALREAAAGLDGGLGELLSLLQDAEAARSALGRGGNAGGAGGAATGESGSPRENRESLRQAQALGERLRQVSGASRGGASLGGIGESLSAAGDASRAEALLGQASRLLMRELLRQRLAAEIGSPETAAPPPEGYRDMVEDYFRSLAEEP